MRVTWRTCHKADVAEIVLPLRARFPLACSVVCHFELALLPSPLQDNCPYFPVSSSWLLQPHRFSVCPLGASVQDLKAKIIIDISANIVNE